MMTIIYILEEQHPGREPFFGLVGGTCEDGETPLETAKRELGEETGLVSDDWELFGSYTRSSRIDHTSHIFIARHCRTMGVQNLDAGEKIQVQGVSWDEFLQIVAHPKFRVQEFALEVLREIFLGKKRKSTRENIEMIKSRGLLRKVLHFGSTLFKTLFD